jgi:hypothetical protein
MGGAPVSELERCWQQLAAVGSSWQQNRRK